MKYGVKYVGVNYFFLYRSHISTVIMQKFPTLKKTFNREPLSMRFQSFPQFLKTYH